MFGMTIGKDAFYRLLKRDFPWRKAHWALIRKLLPQWRKHELGIGYLVADTTIKEKRGHRIEGVCWYHDHTTGRSVPGFEAAHLIWVNAKGVLALDAALRLSKRPLIGNLIDILKHRFDRRSHLGRRFREAADMTKLSQTIAMVKRAVHAGIPARYFLADAWYASLPFVKSIRDLGLIPLIRWKRNKVKFLIPRQDVHHDRVVVQVCQGQDQES